VTRAFELWCPETEAALRSQTEPHIVSGDRRERCESMTDFWAALLETATPPMVSSLQQGGFPPMMDDAEPPAPLPYGVINQKHPFVRMDTYYCKKGGPVSAILVFWYKGAAPVVVMFPPEIVQEVACGICRACDPEQRSMKMLQDLAMQEQAALGLPAPKA
jgi:hypothetical protein